MSGFNLAQTLVGREVERLWDEQKRQFPKARAGEVCRNPVTGAAYVHGADPVRPQKIAACRALLASEWFALNAPADAQPLPLWWLEPERMGLMAYIVRLYERSLRGRKYDVKEHPSFADYIRGVLWENENVEGGGMLPNSPDELRELRKRFPPRELAGMENGFHWCPPKKREQTKKGGRLNQARYDELKRERERANSINTDGIRLIRIDEVVIPDSVLRAVAFANSLYQNSKS